MATYSDVEKAIGSLLQRGYTPEEVGARLTPCGGETTLHHLSIVHKELYKVGRYSKHFRETLEEMRIFLQQFYEMEAQRITRSSKIALEKGMCKEKNNPV